MVKKLFCVFCAVFLLVSCRTSPTGQTGPTSQTKEEGLSKVNIQTATKKIPVFVELARTPSERERGLMFRERLPEDHGMLFVYNEDATHSFWMKNTQISLDIIFLDARGRIIFIAQNTTPFSETPITPPGPCRFVLEVKAGTVEKNGIKAGDVIAQIEKSELL